MTGATDSGGGGTKNNIFMTSSFFPFLTCSVFKSARMHIYIGDIISLQQELTFEEKSQFIHETLAPEMYKVIYVNSFLCSTWIIQKLSLNTSCSVSFSLPPSPSSFSFSPHLKPKGQAHNVLSCGCTAHFYFSIVNNNIIWANSLIFKLR